MSRSRLSSGIIAALLVVGGAAKAQDTQAPGSAAQPTAPVVIDGFELFRVRGVSGFPADKRAAEIARNIREAGADRSVPAELTIREAPLGTWIVAGNRQLFPVVDADAEVEGLSRPVLAQVFRRRAQEAIERYRQDREPSLLWQQVGHGLVATVAFLLALSLGRRAFRRLSRFMDARYRSRVQDVQFRTVEIMRGEQVWQLVLYLRRLAK